MRAIFACMIFCYGCTADPLRGGLPSRPGTDDPPDGGDVWLCELGEQRCNGDVHETCAADGEFLTTERDDCAARGLVCSPPPAGVEDWDWCVACAPGSGACDGDTVLRCSDDGGAWEPVESCDVAGGLVCDQGACASACEVAVRDRSNLGCEYFAVDLDNVSVDSTHDASRQPWGVVVSNPFDVPVSIEVSRDDGPLGAPSVAIVEALVVAPGSLAVLPLDRREVDGSPDQGNSSDRGTGSALSAGAYRIASTHPIVAYQMNPLDNAGVFSNDASLLLPTSALDDEYVVISWPQTVADTDDPATDMGDDYRTFLTIVGVEVDTAVTVTLAADALPLPGRPELGEEHIPAGSTFEVRLGPYEVLNLETDGFLADFTGSRVSASRPVAVFAGSEASDVPTFDAVPERQCCADHLEEQLLPSSTLGTRYAGVSTPSRTEAVRAAGGDVEVRPEGDWFRIVAIDSEGKTRVTTTLDSPWDEIELDGPGDAVTFRATEDFLVESNRRIAFAQFVGSQDTTGIPHDLPGGDPAFVAVPPLEQWREDYVFLTPDGYAFDFFTVVAPTGTTLTIDGGPLPDGCTIAPLGDDFEIQSCQVSFPQIDTSGREPEVRDGRQGDGARRLEADADIGVTVYGFDEFVSYAYAAGTEAQRLW